MSADERYPSASGRDLPDGRHRSCCPVRFWKSSCCSAAKGTRDPKQTGGMSAIQLQIAYRARESQKVRVA
jgi:hypothetical protein